MRITLVSPFDPNPRPGSAGSERVGGVERVFEQVSRNLARRGHDVTLICSTQDAPASQSEHGVNVVRAPRHATFLEAPVTWLSRSIAKDADVVHVAATYPFTTPAVLRRAHALGIPSVLDFHFEPSPGTMFGRLAASFYRHIGPRVYPLCSVALVRSLSYGHSSPSLGRVPADRWRVVPNGIDPTRFKPDGPARPGDYLLFVGRLVAYKGVDTLLKAMASLRPGLPLYIVGEGPAGPALRAQAKALQLDVQFLGRVPDEQLPPLYRGARLTVLPSVNTQECFGISLVESMACGTPVVASRLPGVAEVAAVGGLLADPGDAGSLARHLKGALTPGALPRGPALAAVAHATYSWDAVTDRLESVYQEIVAGRRPAAGALAA
ncbi:MAG: glycosyltransferase family 4 protein [Candidatus Thermoplasmatota archaeon]|jgi:glycosyltransferase involved in cell wall biosynthesis